MKQIKICNKLKSCNYVSHIFNNFTQPQMTGDALSVYEYLNYMTITCHCSAGKCKYVKVGIAIKKTR